MTHFTSAALGDIFDGWVEGTVLIKVPFRYIA